MYIELNEKAECSFNDEEQNFDFEDDGTLMLPVPPIVRLGSGDSERLLSMEHATSWDSTRYYVKCKDEWENEANFVVYP